MAVRVGLWGVTLVVAGCGPAIEDGGGDGEGSGSGSSSSGVTTTSTTGSTTSTTGSDDDAGSTGTEIPDVDCDTIGVSELIGVQIQITSPCAVSVAQAQAGLTAGYVVVIDRPVDGVDSGNSCSATPPGEVLVSWSVRGDGLRHCHCDVGLCPPYTPAPTTLVPGEYAGGFEWFGFDWSGPSDFNAPFGDPFGPGEYTIEVRADGFVLDDVGMQVPFSVVSTRPVLLVE